MKTQLNVGTVCKGQRFVLWPEFNGMQCVVCAPLGLTRGHDSRSADNADLLIETYGVIWANGATFYVKPENLAPRARVRERNQETAAAA